MHTKGRRAAQAWLAGALPLIMPLTPADLGTYFFGAGRGSGGAKASCMAARRRRKPVPRRVASSEEPDAMREIS